MRKTLLFGIQPAARSNEVLISSREGNNDNGKGTNKQNKTKQNKAKTKSPPPKKIKTKNRQQQKTQVSEQAGQVTEIFTFILLLLFLLLDVKFPIEHAATVV